MIDFLSIVNQLPGYSYFRDKSGQFLSVNTNFLRLTGYVSAATFFQEYPKKELLSPETKANYEDDQSVIRKKRALNHLAQQWSFHQTLEVLAYKLPILDGDKQCLGVLSMAFYANEIAYENKVFFDHILNYLPYYIFWKDSDLRYLGCNDNFAKLIGRSHKDEVIGLTDYDFDWQPEDADAFRLADEKVLQFNVPQINQEEVVHHNGEELTMLVSKVPVHEANGSLLGLLGISTDISKLKETERKLQAANRVKAEFIANMSHDFRTPITGMIGMTQSLLLDAQKIESLLAQGGETDVNAIQTLITSVKSDGEMLLSATDQLLHLCTEVMSVASSDIHQQVSKTQPFLIADLLTHNVHLLKPALKKKQLTLKKVVDEALPKAIWGNKLYLERVILNLLSNAIKFTPQGEVRISLKASRHAATNLSTAERSFELVIVVEDTGLGIPEDKFEDIFSYFTRLHPTYEGQFSGFGLGLCHVKEYVTAMNGSIEVQSQLEAGSRFTVRVPVRSYLGAEMMQKELLSPLDCTVAAPPKPWSILLVEDSQIVAKALKVQLTTLGCAVSVSNTAAQALARVENEAFDLLFVDVGLPDFSGIELTKAIRNLSNPEQFSVPIIALTGHGGDEEIQKACLEAGMQQVLIKPASPQALQQTLAQYLQSEDL